MKSKTSFFNKTIFLKNLTLYWPIWACYLLYNVIKVGGSLWSGLRQVETITEDRKLAVMAECLTLNMDIGVIALAAVITGMALFGYLFSSKSASMIHALPVNRRELFFTNVVSGMSFLWGPQIVTFLVSVLVSLGNGVAEVQYLGIWLLSVMGVSFFLFSLSTICAMLTGQLFALPVYFFALNFMSVGLMSGIRNVIELLGYGIGYNSIPDVFLIRILSPITYLFENVKLQTMGYYDEFGNEVIIGIHYQGGVAIVCYALVAIVIYLLAYYCYQKREIECAGDLITFKGMKPVFRWGVGICAAYACAIAIAHFLHTVFIWVSAGRFFVMVLILGAVAFLIADMFVQKTFHVLKRRRVKECGLFLLFVSASFGGVYMIAGGLQNKIPEADEIQYAYIEMNYPVEFEGGEVQKVIDVHKEILSHAIPFQRESMKDSTSMVSVTYVMKNDSRVFRTYQMPVELAQSQELVETISGFESEWDSFLIHKFGYDYQEITQWNASQFEYYDGFDNYMSKTVTAEDAKLLYQAIEQDAKEGTLQKYNTNDYAMDDSGGYEGACLYMNYSHDSNEWQDIYQRMSGDKRQDNYALVDSQKEGYAQISFGSDCTNIMNMLKQVGLLDPDEEMFFDTAKKG